MDVNGHKIPELICSLISNGVWPTASPNSQESNPLLGPEAAQRMSPDYDRIILMPPPFYSIADDVLHGNAFWTDDLTNVGEIDYDKAVIFADFGLGSDSPIILYYGDGPSPVVMYLGWRGHGREISHEWVRTHDSFEEFAKDVGLA